LTSGARDRPAQDRRRRAAQEYGVSVERFRKYHERIVIEQVAEAVLELCQPPRPAQRPTAPPELTDPVHLEYSGAGGRFPVIVHVEPVELLRDIDVVVAPSNTYLEPPQPYKASVSAALRRAAAERGADGAVTGDVVGTELRAWLAEHARPGLPVSSGTVAATSAGALARQGVRRIYHAAIASPRPGTNDYDIEPASLTQAVHAVFATARSERQLFTPPLRSLAFPLLGAGRGGLAAATSFTWMWSAIEREMRADSSWLIHFVTRRRVTADAIVSALGGL
jgi:O-acetyl-ADP-ribose deacetylase (regulator of RNase III)